MDAVHEPGIEELVLMSSAQVGKTEILLNLIGYFIHQDPSPILVVQPNVHPMAESFSKDRLDPMIRDTPALRYKVSAPKTRDSGNTIFHKRFPGGHVTIIGANAPASLASRPIRIVLFDEVDKYPVSAGKSGDPLSLGQKRTTTFTNRLIVKVSTPGERGRSNIEEAFERSDQRYFFVPCPFCGEMQVLRWAQVKFERDKEKKIIEGSTCYECVSCEKLIPESRKLKMLAGGEWRATAPGNGKTAGFRLNELYSTFSTWERVAVAHQEALGNSESMKAWTNESMGELWEHERDKVDHTVLYTRREKYSAVVPAGGLVLVAGADVQKDRLEVDVRAWGRGFENWGVEYRVIYGDPARDEVWDELLAYLSGSWRHESGVDLQVSAGGFDAGYLPDRVYRFCHKARGRRFWAVMGDKGQEGVPLFKISDPRRGKNRRPVDLMIIGTDTAKSMIHSFLRVPEPGPCFCHWPAGDDYELRYFNQLAAEEIRYHYSYGRKVRRWHQTGPNEALDCFVYNLAAVHRLNPVWDALADRLYPPDEEEPKPKSKAKATPRRRSWMDNY